MSDQLERWQVEAFEQWLDNRVYVGGGGRQRFRYMVKKEFHPSGRATKAWWSDQAVASYGDGLYSAAHAARDAGLV